MAILAVFPHPDHPHRYVAIHGGVSPDGVTWGSHLDMQLLPDYVVYCGGKTLDWEAGQTSGVFGNIRQQSNGTLKIEFVL